MQLDVPQQRGPELLIHAHRSGARVNININPHTGLPPWFLPPVNLPMPNLSRISKMFPFPANPNLVPQIREMLQDQFKMWSTSRSKKGGTSSGRSRWFCSCRRCGHHHTCKRMFVLADYRKSASIRATGPGGFAAVADVATTTPARKSL